jgi:hypothetical protein
MHVWDKERTTTGKRYMSGTTTEEMSHLAQATYSVAAKGTLGYMTELFDVAGAETRANLEFARKFMSATSVAELVELSTSYAGRQFDLVADQTRDLAALTQQLAADLTEPMRSAGTRAM